MDETSMERKDSVHSSTGTTDLCACARREIRFPLQYIFSLIYIEKDEGWFEEGTEHRKYGK